MICQMLWEIWLTPASSEQLKKKNAAGCKNKKITTFPQIPYPRTI